MTDQELRELVRESIAKQLGGHLPAPAADWRPTPAGLPIHASHGVYTITRTDVPSGDADSGPCIIEPSVPCTHCDYCKSHGH